MPRLFVALSPPPEQARQLAELARDIPGARTLRPEQAHVTLRFLGEIEAQLVPELRRALSRVSCPDFEATIRGLGCFP